ncbi:hypothetical protein E3Q24_02798 [Wallemia mellicola]|nr:hypothetical protein E3Q24_02798 [Wallemia mellicola]
MEEESDSHSRCPKCPSIDNDQDIADVDDIWIGCEACDNWYHCACVNSYSIPYRLADIDSNSNLAIKKKPEPRKSKRSKLKHDYAALNDGITPSYLHVERLPFLQTENYEFKRMKGEDLTIDWLETDPNSLSEPIVVPDPAGLDMKMPASNTSIDHIAKAVGIDKPVEVIDCATQNLSKYPWTLGEWANHYYKRRQAPEIEKTLNVISLEVSDTEFAKEIIPPKFVRNLDWVGNFWPQHKKKDAPRVLLYVLMSLKGSFTDWHVDFAGSSVFYHVLRGSKTFYLSRPNSYNLQQYKMWSESADQGSQWFGDLADTTYKVTLEAGNTLIIPTGWIHAVHTPTDSLVIGGNFVHSYGIEGQQKIVQIEIDTKVPLKFRFPGYQTLCWYVANHYKNTLKDGKKVHERVLSSLALRIDNPVNENGVADEKALKIAKTYKERFPADDIEIGPFELAAWLNFNEPLSKKNVKRRRGETKIVKEEGIDEDWTEPKISKETTSVQRKCKRPFVNDKGEWEVDMSKPENGDGEDATIYHSYSRIRKWNVSQPDVYICEENINLTQTYSFVK